MPSLTEPKIASNQRNIVKTFVEICIGITILGCYAILWLLMWLLGMGIYNWIM